MVGMAEEAPLTNQDPTTGRFVKGNKAHVQRSNSLVAAQIRQSLLKEFSPAEVAQAYRQAYEMALEKNNPKLLVQVLDSYLDRVIGKPVQTNLNVSETLSEWKEVFGHNDETVEVVEGEIIEGVE